MDEIKFMEKPEWVSWEDVSECIYRSHQTNKSHGFEMVNANITADELKSDLKEGHCFVALEGNRVVGTASIKFFKNKRKWWTKDMVAYYCYDAILPEYRGTDVFFGLNEIRRLCFKQSGVRIHQFHTAEYNKTVLKINEKGGFKKVQYAPTGKGAKYYSVTMVKWMDGCPYSDWFINLMFNLSKFVAKTFWTPGYKLRFWPK